MRWTSDEMSAAEGDPSVLAIFETLVLTSLTLYAGWRTGWWWHLLASSLVSPLSLLRTDQSVARAYEMLDKVRKLVERMRSPDSQMTIKLAPVVFIIVVLVPLFCRFAAFASITCFHPLKALAAFPRNWWKSVLCTDLCISPTLMPGDEECPDEVSIEFGPSRVYDFFSFFKPAYLWYGPTLTDKLLNLFFIFVVIPPATVLSFAIRLSVKASAIIWFPVLWAVWPPKKEHVPWTTYFAIRAELPLYRATKWLSIACLAAFVAKCLVILCQTEFATKADYVEKFLEAKGLRPTPEMLQWTVAFIRPSKMPLWQLATTTNCLLGFLYGLLVANWLAHYKHGVPPSDQSIQKTTVTIVFFSRLLSSYTIACNIYLVYCLASKVAFPQIDSRLVPWV